MNELWNGICQHALVKPDVPAVLEYKDTLETVYTWSQLQQQIATLAGFLRDQKLATLALHADNCAAWIIVDLASDLAGVTLLPLPGFFSAAQLKHALATVTVDAILTDHADHLPESVREQFVAGLKVCGLHYLQSAAPASAQSAVALSALRNAAVPDGTHKITFTSGSTGAPKGVCLSAEHLQAVTTSILDATAQCHVERHLCVLPLATLLENIAGVHAPLRHGAQVVVASQAALGFNGASGFSLQALLRAIATCRPSSLILVPQLLEALVMSSEAGWKPPQSLSFVAVGGATVSASLLERAWAQNLPVYEGYGLSECGSVVSLNAPNARRNGSLGRPLPHSQVEIVEGEIVVRGRAFLGYAGERDSWRPDNGVGTCATGDLGYLDADGYLHFIGRRKNQLVSSFGRNISPEWIEAELSAFPMIAQSVVLGDSRPFCVALIAARSPQIADDQIERCVAGVNSTLPDYARIRAWKRLAAPMAIGSGTENDLLTSNGRPRRAQIEQHFHAEIEAMYSQPLQSSSAPHSTVAELSIISEDQEGISHVL